MAIASLLELGEGDCWRVSLGGRELAAGKEGATATATVAHKGKLSIKYACGEAEGYTYKLIVMDKQRKTLAALRPMPIGSSMSLDLKQLYKTSGGNPVDINIVRTPSDPELAMAARVGTQRLFSLDWEP